MPYPEICKNCVYRGREMTSSDLVCQSPVVSYPDENGECDEFWVGDDEDDEDAEDEGDNVGLAVKDLELFKTRPLFFCATHQLENFIESGYRVEEALAEISARYGG